MQQVKQTAENKPPRVCACGGDCRPNQRNCHYCHALANQIYRYRVKHQAEKLEKLLLKMIARNITLADVSQVEDNNH